VSKKDIEEFVEAPGRDEKVKEVRKKNDELGILTSICNLYQLLEKLWEKESQLIIGKVLQKRVSN